MKRMLGIVAVCVAWVGVALLITFGLGSSQTRTLTRAASAPQTPSAFASSFIPTPFVAGGLWAMVAQESSGSLVMVTRASMVPTDLPARYFMGEAVRVESVGDPRSLHLIDFRLKPDIDPDVLK